MHNSEKGYTVAFTLDESGQKVTRENAFPQLLRTNCLGCHSEVGNETIIVYNETSRFPIVFNLAEPTYPPDSNNKSTSTLAGGNFHWVVKYGDDYGHNVLGIGARDYKYPPGTIPPGGVNHTDANGDPVLLADANGDPVGLSGVSCDNCHESLFTSQSGCEGCHVPFHHADSADVLAVKDKGWYRFLGSVMLRNEQEGPPAEGVIGIEDPNWEQNPLDGQHNTYQGTTASSLSYLDSGAINQKCIGCHSRFHNETIANSTWIRHPDNAVIPDTGEFADYTTYDPLVPVARQNVNDSDAGFLNINHNSDMVSCISCHRPHGSPYPAMMRWGYRYWPGLDPRSDETAQNGCAVCHTYKN
jgi:cytochrome c553